MASKVYASNAQLESVTAQLTEVEAAQCYAEVMPAPTLFFPQTLQARINAIDPAKAGKTQLRDYASGERFKAETGGISVDGHAVATDVVAQSKIADAKMAFDNGATSGTIPFKCADGTFFDADAAALTGIYNAVRAHVQACYGAEKAAVAAINSGRVVSEAQVDGFFAGIPTLPAAQRSGRSETDLLLQRTLR